MRRLRTRTPLKPQSVRLNNTDVANQHQFYAEVQKERVRSSLLASGITAVVYSFLQSGRKCTCRLQVSLLDDDGNLSQDGVDSILQDAAGAGHVLTGRVRKPVLDAADVGLDSLNKRYDRLLDDLEESEGLADGTLEGLDDDLNELGELDPDRGDTTFFGGMNQDRCGICFGSGFVGGFRMSGGHRTILTTESEIDSNATTCSIDKKQSPFRFTGGGRVVFTNVRLPYRTDQRLHVLRVWKNDTVLPKSSYTINRADIIAAANEGARAAVPRHREATSQELRVTLESSTDNDLDFSHIEIQTIHRKVPVDLIQVPDNFQPNLEGRAANATISLPPETPISKFSVIRESKHGRAWQVSQVSPHLNNRGVAVWYEAEARLVAQHELYNRLVGTP